MKVSRLKIRNFRGIKSADLFFPDHVVLIGDNNTGKSTVLEAIDLVLGPERLSRRAPIDEHDFYLGRYLPEKLTEGTDVIAVSEVDKYEAADTSGDDADPDDEAAEDSGTAEASDAPQIRVEAVITRLSSEQRAHFKDYIEWWNTVDGEFYTTGPLEGVDADAIVEALRVTFIGEYVVEEDDFEGRTYFARSLEESDNPQPFFRRDKHYCGFLFLRSLRTGRRAPQPRTRQPSGYYPAAEGNPPADVGIDNQRPRSTSTLPAIRQLGISGELESINTALSKYVPKEWGAEPHLRVSALTRDHLRNVITAFMATGKGSHAAPYYRQGTGTLNMLVLAMLSQIAEDKQNVIFAMEEPETAIPPYAQKRIVHELRKLSAQSIFTSHSPYVLEEFGLDETVVLSRASAGQLSQASVSLPDSVKHKRYRQEFRTRFCEGVAFPSHIDHGRCRRSNRRPGRRTPPRGACSSQVQLSGGAWNLHNRCGEPKHRLQSLEASTDRSARPSTVSVTSSRQLTKPPLRRRSINSSCIPRKV